MFNKYFTLFRCWGPAEFPGTHVDYANSISWISKSYYFYICDLLPNRIIFLLPDAGVRRSFRGRMSTMRTTSAGSRTPTTCISRTRSRPWSRRGKGRNSTTTNGCLSCSWCKHRFVTAAPSADNTCDTPLLNTALLFLKPHANTAAAQDLVRQTLQQHQIDIVSEVEIDAQTIERRKLIDQHYYSIASKATILPVHKIPVPVDQFENTFGESWKTVLKQNRACNAMEACKRFDCTPSELNDAWQKVEPVKFGGGFYCGK